MVQDDQRCFIGFDRSALCTQPVQEMDKLFALLQSKMDKLHNLLDHCRRDIMP